MANQKYRLSENHEEAYKDLVEARGDEFKRSSIRRYRISEEDYAAIQNSVDNTSNSSTKDYSKEPKFVLSAWSQDSDMMMDIDEYCEVYGLPREDISSYKLISHTGTPYYNIVFKQMVNVESIDFEKIIDNVLDKLDILETPPVINKVSGSGLFTRLITTDTHIGMDTNKEDTAMYPVMWNELSIMETAETVVANTLINAVGDTLYWDDLGDSLDGWNAQTTRGGHELPQNMTNEEAFEVALNFRVKIVKGLVSNFDNIVIHNVSNDNHAGSFGAILNHAFKRIVEAVFNNVYVTNIPEFIGHYIVGKHAFVISHGKDRKSLKFGFKPVLDPKQIEKIDHYLKYNNVYREADFIEFSKGDSHQMLFDYTTAQDFDYFNFPALSPSSEWVMTNYKRGLRGFVIQQVHYNKRNKIMIPIIID